MGSVECQTIDKTPKETSSFRVERFVTKIALMKLILWTFIEV